MTQKKPPRNIAASVRARLTERARAKNENVQLVLTRYAIERLLYRLGASPQREHFVLKGAMLFSLWSHLPYRSTGDLDLLGAGDPSPERMKTIFAEILSAPTIDDGVSFKPETLRSESAREDDDYSGIRMTLDASIAGTNLPVQIDIGFGDVVMPGTQEIEYPSMLDMPAPSLRAYPPETVVAEKFQAIVALGMTKSRMKDFFDIWVISETSSFEAPGLVNAIRATFERRKTNLPTEVPIALTDAFEADVTKRAQWQGFIRRTAFAMSPKPLPDIIERIRMFAFSPIQSQAMLGSKWLPGGPWSSKE